MGGGGGCGEGGEEKRGNGGFTESGLGEGRNMLLWWGWVIYIE